MAKPTRPEIPPLMLGVHGIPLVFDPHKGRSSGKAQEFLMLTRDMRDPKGELSPVTAYLLETEGRFRILIDVTETALKGDLRKAIPLAFKLRDRLLAYQGDWGLDIDALISEQLLRDKARQTWTHLATRVNYKVAKGLQDGFSLYPKRILRAMELPESEVDEVLTMARDEIANGKPPFPSWTGYPERYPVDRVKVREAVWNYQKRAHHPRRPEVNFIDDSPQSAPSD